MQISLGKSYRTRGGMCPITREMYEPKTISLDFFFQGAQSHPFMRFRDGKYTMYHADGRHALGLTQHDIVEEIKI